MVFSVLKLESLSSYLISCLFVSSVLFVCLFVCLFVFYNKAYLENINM